MEFYCGTDLHARTSQVAVIDEDVRVHTNVKTPNRLENFLEILRPFKPAPKIVVESTFNWYWLIDGLQDAGYDVTLAHALGLYMITKAKVKTDRRDAVTLAKLLRVDAIPKAYIYPKAARPIRDLVRTRTHLVQHRSAEYTHLRRFLYQLGVIEHSRKTAMQLDEEDLKKYLDDPRVQMAARQVISRIKLFSKQVRELEKEIIKASRNNPEYNRLTQIPGFGKALAAITFYEIGDIGRFKSSRNFSSYCRVVPGAANSENKVGRGRGSKQGNSHLKGAFGQAAVHAVRCHSKIRQCFERHLKRHRGRAAKLISYNIIAHKLALAVYHMLKEGTNYNEKLLFGN
jgi:transposase